MVDEVNYRIALLGCGRMGQLHAERVLRDGRGTVTAVFDQSVAAARELVSQWAPTARICNQLDDLLRLEEVDAVIVCTPTTSHFDQVRACGTRGWHILCEKPLAESRERTSLLIDEARQRSSISMLAYQRRFWATYRTLRREVQSGRWGPIQAVTSHNVERWEQTIAGTWRNDPEINIGGFVGDAGNHKLDQLFFTTGLAVTELQARSFNGTSRVLIQTTVMGVLEGGPLLCMDFIGNAQHLAEDFHIHCEHADLMVRDRKVWIARQNCVTQLDDMEPESNPVSGFFDVLDGTLANPAPFEIAMPVWELLAAIRESSHTRQPVSLRTPGPGFTS